MHDRLKPLPRAVIGEHDPPQCAAPQSARIVEYIVPEFMANIVERRFAGGNHLARNHVGVDDRRTQLRKHACDRGLATGDAAGQTDTQWFSGAGVHLMTLTPVTVPVFT